MTNEELKGKFPFSGVSFNWTDTVILFFVSVYYLTGNASQQITDFSLTLYKLYPINTQMPSSCEHSFAEKIRTETLDQFHAAPFLLSGLVLQNSNLKL